MADKPILLVDDDRDDVELTLWAFKKVDIGSDKIVIARDGVEVLDLLLPHSWQGDSGQVVPLRPALVLMDINMPRMNGLEALRHLRADPTTQALPVIMMTSSREENDIRASQELGVTRYVQKPVSAENFLPIVSMIREYWKNQH